MLAPDGRISIGELVEEELLLTLPIVPLHEEATLVTSLHRCAARGDAAREPETQKPFAQLAELLKRQ